MDFDVPSAAPLPLRPSAPPPPLFRGKRPFKAVHLHSHPRYACPLSLPFPIHIPIPITPAPFRRQETWLAKGADLGSRCARLRRKSRPSPPGSACWRLRCCGTPELEREKKRQADRHGDIDGRVFDSRLKVSTMNSPTATNTDSTRPAARTMKMPPMFSTPRALASLLSSSGQPFPRHHFSFIMCSLPSSCS
ncbi:LOW QUALITY PROTEIN: hypothetical protein CRUP_014572 [Coryphaenoides rupestris]|nr:LOW QUALITY PROTEIN: hypothetical protein CRUP_014572 [Coryphaenoides rupestris]